jgi:hypothetical protein
MSQERHDLNKFAEGYLQIIRISFHSKDDLYLLQNMLDTNDFFSIPKITRSELYRTQETLKIIEGLIVDKKERRQLNREISKVLKGEISRMKKAHREIDEIRKEQATLPPSHESILQTMVQQLEGLDERQLEAGLGVILKDTLQYLFTAPRSDDVLFRELVNDVIAEEQKTKTLPQHRLIYVDPNDPVPIGIVASVVKGERDLSRLRSPEIQHEWTIYPARKFLKKFNAKLKKNICGRNGVYGQFKKNMLGQADLPTAIAATIVTGHFSPESVWFPLAAYVGILIAKSGLDTYCEKKSKSRTDTKRTT